MVENWGKSHVPLEHRSLVSAGAVWQWPWSSHGTATYGVVSHSRNQSLFGVVCKYHPDAPSNNGLLILSSQKWKRFGICRSKVRMLGLTSKPSHCPALTSGMGLESRPCRCLEMLEIFGVCCLHLLGFICAGISESQASKLCHGCGRLCVKQST